LTTACVLFAAAIPAAADHIVIDMTAAPATQQILPGNETVTWEYTATLASGREGSVIPVEGSYLAPTISVQTGDRVTVNFHNELDYETCTHWHGLDVPDAADGHPKDAMPAGGDYTYDFIVRNRAGTYWYHPHPDMMTGEQAYRGLAGYFIVSDPQEQALELPRGAQDIPLCLQDADFDGNNQLVYTPNMMGFFGSTLLVNGNPNVTMEVATRVHRLRVLNGSQSRIFKLAFDDGTPIIAIATGGGMLESPLELPYVIVGPGERVELWADFSNKSVGDIVTLETLTFSGAGTGQGESHDVASFEVTSEEEETLTLPTSFGPIGEILSDAYIHDAKTWAISMQQMAWTVNGGLFSMYYAAPNEQAIGDTVDQVTITNTSGQMQLAHPMHFHGRQFQIQSRTCLSGDQANWDTVKDGYVNDGWKDTFVIMPGETVKFLVRWGKHEGLFVYHCHNLPHEDMGMMRNFNVVAPTCPADLNRDDAVDVNDMLELLSNWDSPFGDTTGDDLTDVNDVLELISAWGSCD